MYEHALSRCLLALGLPVMVGASGGCSRVEAAPRTHDSANAQPHNFSCPQFVCIEPPAARSRQHAPHPFEMCSATAPASPDGTFGPPPGSGFDRADTVARSHDVGHPLCCYFDPHMCGGGRTLADAAGVPHVAAAVERRDWLDAPDARPACADVPREVRRALAAHWLREAASEHASVASFARASLRLMAAGAPPELLEGVHRAALDEVAHARGCYALATAYGGRAVGPDALAIPLLAAGRATLADVAEETFVEACVNETVAALTARAAAERARDPAVRALLERIAADEARHAELAWATVAWAVREGGDAVAARVAARFADDPGDAAAGDDAGLASHGVLSRDERAAIRARAWVDVVAPCVRALAVLTRAEA